MLKQPQGPPHLLGSEAGGGGVPHLRGGPVQPWPPHERGLLLTGWTRLLQITGSLPAM